MMTKHNIDIDSALLDKKLLGAALGDPQPWQTWLAVLRASFGLPLSEEQRAIFHSVAGERGPPNKRVRELWCICGRRSGKSRMAAALAVFIATVMPHKLSRGETGHVLLLAASRDQAQLCFGYIRAFLEDSPVLRQEIESITSTEIRLRNNIVIGTHANSFRSIRGRTIVACIFDEVALWRDEASATPDVEVYRAVLPALMTTGGMLIGISTPYRKIGLLHTKHRDHFGVTDDDVLIVQGPSTAFNPTLSQDKIASAIAADPDGASSEWLATFRTDIAAFLDDTMIDAAIDRDRPLELPPRTHNYLCFVDPSGGKHDAFTICIGHEEGETFVADVVRGVKPPFDPHEVAKDFAALAREYHCSEVHGDRYSAEWVAMAFENAGISYQSSEKNKSQLYLEALPLFARGAITFPDLPPLVRELRLLERQNHRGGRATVDHPTSGSDDFANVLCACAATAKGDVYDPFGPWLDGEDSRPPENVEKRKERAALTTSARPFWGMPVVGGG